MFKKKIISNITQKKKPLFQYYTFDVKISNNIFFGPILMELHYLFMKDYDNSVITISNYKSRSLFRKRRFLLDELPQGNQPNFQSSINANSIYATFQKVFLKFNICNAHWRRTKVETTGATQDFKTLISRLFKTFLYFETKKQVVPWHQWHHLVRRH